MAATTKKKSQLIKRMHGWDLPPQGITTHKDHKESLGPQNDATFEGSGFLGAGKAHGGHRDFAKCPNAMN